MLNVIDFKHARHFFYMFGCLVVFLAAAIAVRAATVFNETTSLRVLNYTWAAYCPREQLKSWDCDA